MKITSDNKIAAAVLVVFGVWMILRAWWGFDEGQIEISHSDAGSPRRIVRKEAPFEFWASLLILYLSGLALVVAAFCYQYSHRESPYSLHVIVLGTIVVLACLAPTVKVALSLYRRWPKLKLQMRKLNVKIKILKIMKKWPARQWRPNRRAMTQDGDFLELFFSLLAAFAGLDGQISQDEVDLIDRAMKSTLRLDRDQRLLAMQVFRRSSQSSLQIEDLAKKITHYLGRDKILTECLFDFFLAVAHSDGHFALEERSFLARLASALGLSAAEFKQIEARNFVARKLREELQALEQQLAHESKTEFDARFRRSASDDAAADWREPYLRILGCSNSDSPTAIRRAYRQLALRFHPDRLRAQGIGDEFRALNEQRFRIIQNAYEQLCERQNSP